MSGFDHESTTDDVLAGVDLTGKRFLVTGASAGLGLETTRALAAHGASVTMAARDLGKGTVAMEQVLDAVPDADLDLRELDLADLASIRAFAHGFVEDHPQLDVLIANAGVMACPQGTTVDGFETQLGTNHLGHFLLIQLLTPSLVAAGRARVVLLSSAGHRFSDVDLDDPGFEQQPYDAWVAYGRSKTANVLCAVALDERLRDQGVRAFAVHPGGIHTELGRHLTDETLQVLADRQARSSAPIRWKTIPQGAATTVWAATSPELDGLGGRYLEDCGVAEVSTDPDASKGVRAYAVDPERAARCGSCPSDWWAETVRTLVTERLELRPLRADDAEALHPAYADADLLRHWHRLPRTDVAATTAMLAGGCRRRDALGRSAPSGTDDALGHVGFPSTTIEPRRPTAFGYLLRREAQGQGYATEAGRAVVDHGFRDLGVAACELWIYEGNDPSRRVAERLGAEHRGTFWAFNLELAAARRTHVYAIEGPVALAPEVVRVTPVLSVPDVAAAVAWWRDELGFGVEWVVGDPPMSASVQLAWLPPDAASVRLRLGPPTPVRLACAVPERFDELADGLGIAPVDQPWGMREVAVTDPWGTTVVFETPGRGRR